MARIDSSYYRTRKAQVLDFAKDVEAKQTTLRQALRDACMVGACEERDHATKIIRSFGLDFDTTNRLLNAIFAKSVLQVIGYED